jgi:predicted nucleic acid-binding protein
MAAPFPPDGTAIFVDANVFYYHFVRSGDLSEWCSDLLERATTGRLSACTSAPCLAECIHKVMATEAAFRFAIPRPSVVTHLRHHPEHVTQLVKPEIAAAQIARFALPVLTIDTPVIVDATVVSRTHGMLTNDAISVALMRRHGLAHLATNDDDFGRVPGLTLWKPRVP